MAEPTQTADESDPWNFSSPTDDVKDPAELASPEVASSDLPTPDTSKHITKPDLTSPVSDDDFSAWDAPHENGNAESQNATIDSVVAPLADNVERDTKKSEDTPEDTPNGVLNEPVAATPDVPADSKDDVVDALPGISETDGTTIAQPSLDTQPSTEQPEASQVDTIFASQEENVDFTELLAKGPETVEDENNEDKSEEDQKGEQSPSHGNSPVEVAGPSSVETNTAQDILIAESVPETTSQGDISNPGPAKEGLPGTDVNEQAEKSSVNAPAEELLPPHQVNGTEVSPWASLDDKEIPKESDSTGNINTESEAQEVTEEDNSAWGNQANDDLDSDGDDFFNQLKTQTKPIFAPPEAESRFEEGVPLLDDDTPASPEVAVQEETTTADPFANDNDDDAEGFFSSAPKAKPTPPVPQHITRKSTSQVMESVGFDLASPASEASAAAAFDEALKGDISEVEAPQFPADTADQSDDDDIVAQWGAGLSDTDEDDLMAQWSAALDEGAPQAGLQSPVANEGLNSPFETPQPKQTPPRAIPSAYVPHQPPTSELVGGIAFPGAPPTSTAVPPYYSQPANPVTLRGESFAERSKEGYKSPYDLPDDLSLPRRPVSTPKPVPPRVDSALPPPPSAGLMQPSAPVQAPVAPPPAPKNFFEELPPPAPRSHRPASSGRYTPGPATAPSGTSLPPLPQNPYAPAPTAAPPAPVAPVAPIGVPPAQSALQPPEALDPYASLASSAPAAPNAPSRYSPKPPALQPGAKPPSRYSPAPPSVGGRNRYASQPLGIPGQVNLPFQPRTSSPLAYHEKVSYQPDGAKEQQQHPPPSLEPSVDLSPPRGQRPSIDQKTPYAPPEYLNEFTKRLVPNNDSQAAPPTVAVPTSPKSNTQVPPPRRSQTQSPGQQMTSPRALAPPADNQARPVSAHAPGSPVKTVNPYAQVQQPSSHARVFSQQLDFIAPTDGQEKDPLERWKGAPIFKFGFGGAMVSCFPKHIPRYSAGQPNPMIMPTLGEPKISQLDSWLPPIDTIAPHPGPLKTKSKKKDVVAWLSSKIAILENEITPNYNPLQPDIQKRHEEKVLLWKVTKILVENDGVFDGTPEIQKSLRQAIFPNLIEPQSDGAYGGGLLSGAGAGKMGLPAQSDATATDNQWAEELRANLILGEREKAVWSAVDRRLWGHAMVLSSTMERSVWKQVVQEFVRREVRSSNDESIAALYQTFGGNIEESVDELVPPSARAGHHLISKSDGQGVMKDALAGLESWRDTFGLILSNRSSEDPQALVALGSLLASYGRIEAAHVCFIFSRNAIFGGADDPQTNIVLLGADHQRVPGSLLDDDAILLTEVYEFATTVLATTPAPTLPYLLAFKLVHAKSLADRGRKVEAQNYCDSVAAAIKANTRPSPYHHAQLFIEVDELSARLRQTTSDGASSWISASKVSGSMWARFNSFVVGEDNDGAPNGSGKAEVPDVGPFANVAGTPTVSRSPSMSDMYGSFPGGQPAPIGGPSKYHPSNQYAPNASPDQYRGRSSLDSYRSVSGSSAPFGQRRASGEASSPVEAHFQGGPYASPGLGSYQPTPPQSSYMPLAPVKEDASHTSGEGIQPAVNGLFYQPAVQEPSTDSQSPYYQGPPGMPQADDEPGYMPPSIPNSYEPPSFAPGISIDEVEPDDSPDVKIPKKKKSFMDLDDDDDIGDRAAALQKSQRAENDRKAEDAFKKAAEEDGKLSCATLLPKTEYVLTKFPAKRAAEQPAKKGWFGGWFGGAKKDEGASATGNAPIRAKLGEENSFYYDSELKKWVNKKDPGSATAARATPPPPRGSAPPSRATSYGSMPPPPAPLSAASGSRPPSSGSEAGFLSSSPAFSGLGVPPPLPRSVSTSAAVSTPPGSSGGPPPRPSSSLTHAQSIDDLLAAPTARKGGSARGKKKGRYVDVMAQ